MKITVCKPEHPGGHVVWIHEHDTAELWNLLKNTGITLIAVTDADWNRDLSPWQAEKVFRGGDFTGGAPAHLRNLLQELDAAERTLGFPVKHRTIAGYSLAGLFALWAVHVTDVFDSAVSASGSLWFDGFTDFVAEHRTNAKSVALSLGDAEYRTKNPRMAEVEARTRECCALLVSRGIPCTLDFNPGGHFTDVPGRLARAILRIDENPERNERTES